MKGNGAKTAHDHWYSAGKSRPIRNSDAIEPTRQYQIMDLQRFPKVFWDTYWKGMLGCKEQC
jgi:hypothetical protein